MDIGTFWSAAAIPLLILIARIAEASLESVRTIYISKGHANLAAYVGIVKTGIWLISTGLVLTNLTQVLEPLRIPCRLRYRDGAWHGDRELYLDRVRDRPAHYSR